MSTVNLTERAEFFGVRCRAEVQLALRTAGGGEAPIHDEMIYELARKAAGYAEQTLDPVPAKIRIIADLDPSNPREDCDQLWTMYCRHSRYNLGDKGAEDPRIECPSCDGGGHDRRNYDKDCRRCKGTGRILNPEIVVMLPLGLYDHSGISMYIGGTHWQDPAGWDSGQVGVIYATRTQVREYMDWTRVTAKRRAEIEKQMAGEVAVYDQYLRGDVYGFIVEDHDGEQLDSCWGFYGTDWKTNGMAEHWDDETRALADQEGVGDVEYPRY